MQSRLARTVGALTVTCAVLSATHASVKDSVIGAWLLDEDVGAEVEDISGNERHAMVIGQATFVDGPFGQAFESDGSRLEVPHDDAFLTPTFTLMAWVSVPVVPNDWSMVILAKDQWPNRNYAMYVANGSGVVHFAFGTAAQQDVGNFNGATIIADGEWHHVAMTYDMEMRRIYVDGVLDGEKPSTDEPGNPGSPVVLGKLAGGMIDEALTPDEIVGAMNEGIAAVLGGLSVGPQAKLATTWADLRAPR
ncbi:MAG: LamG domain-containing protein [Candidatus Poribacteria bacterium]